MSQTHAFSHRENSTSSKASSALPKSILPAHEHNEPGYTQPQPPSFAGITPELISPAEVGVQAQLKIGAANDKYEKEADAIAAQVVEALKTPIHQGRKVSSMLDLRLKDHRKSRRPFSSQQLTRFYQGGQSKGINQSDTGRPLDIETATRMGRAFGNDFGDVRINTSPRADSMARGLNARAFTTANTIYFRNGEYSPTTQNGTRLLAHELTHVVQQGKIGEMLQCSRTKKASEKELDDALEKNGTAYVNIIPQAEISAAREKEISKYEAQNANDMYNQINREEACTFNNCEAPGFGMPIANAEDAYGAAELVDQERFAEHIKEQREKVPEKAREQAEKQYENAIDLNEYVDWDAKAEEREENKSGWFG